MNHSSYFKFSDVIISARKPHALSEFYQTVFGFRPLKEDSQKQSGDPVPEVIRLLSPGYGTHGPVLTLVSPGSPGPGQGPLQVNDTGYAHLCFEADDVRGSVRKIIGNGGTLLSHFPEIDTEICVYTKDPESNIVEVHLPVPISVFSLRGITRFLGSLVRTKLKLRPSKGAKIRFLHVNLISGDWKNLSGFYCKVFGCRPQGALRNYQGKWIESLVDIPGVHVTGRHIGVPGYDKDGPTLEIFTYNKQARQGPLGFNDHGIVCTGYETKDMAAVLGAVKDAGGTIVSENQGVQAVIKDPDGNLVQLTQP